MSVEAIPRPTLPEELPFQERLAQFRQGGSTEELNIVKNQRVGFEKQANEALKREEPLQDASDAADTAEELYNYQQGGEADKLSPRAQDALAAGETPDSLLELASTTFQLFKDEKAGQNAELDFDEQLDDARESYIRLLVKQPKLPGKRKAHREQLRTAEQTYNDALLNKITGVMTLDEQDPKAPYAPPVTRELHNQNPELKELAGGKLHVLVDQLAREQLTKSKMIEDLSSRNAKRVLNALTTNRPLRAIIAGAIFAGAATTMNKGLLPEGAHQYVEGVQYAMELLPAYLTIRESTIAAGEGLDRMRHRRQMKRDMAALTQDTLLSELALRTVYTNVEYQNGNILARSAGDPAKNTQAFNNINKQFDRLERKEGYRGGKPYSAEQVMPYITDLYVRRKEQVDSIVESQNPQEAFVGLCREIISADTAAMTKKNQMSPAKKTAARAFALAGAIIATKWVNQATYVREINGAALAVPHIEAT